MHTCRFLDYLGENTDKDYNSYKVEDLKKEVKKRDLEMPKGAKKNDLVDILKEHDKANI